MSNKVQVIKAPQRVNKTRTNSISLFLAGSIEMGKAVDWQKEVTEWIEKNCPDQHVTIFNPRRSDWDSSWEQDMNNPQFFEQVSWELDRIDHSDLVIIYFAPDTKSPISLLELGKVTHCPEKVLVCCPEGFWRKGNVDIVCYLAGIPVFPSLSVFKEELKRKISKLHNT